jgi:tRNA U34 5-methylaminomethyl-2-thiouridine-forming methyltransferase MnmC
VDEIEIIVTGDGSHSLRNTTLQETYHSVHGAIQESNHVFIQHGLFEYETRNPGKPLRIFEVGFGTGLNALLTLDYTLKHDVSIYYESWEKFPLDEKIINQLNYRGFSGDRKTFEIIHQAEWNQAVTILPGFTLRKQRRDILLEPIDGNFDIIYYDAFAPTKQPELWTKEVLRKITASLAPGGFWVTYCAKGQIKRDLAELGLRVESLPGPPGKKEMTRATRIA